MNIRSIRSGLYWTARRLGDVNAVGKTVSSKSAGPVFRRFVRVLLGRLFGRIINKI